MFDKNQGPPNFQEEQIMELKRNWFLIFGLLISGGIGIVQARFRRDGETYDRFKLGQ